MIIFTYLLNEWVIETVTGRFFEEPADQGIKDEPASEDRMSAL